MSNNKMLIDATHPEETRVVVLRDKRVEDFDFETASKKPLRGNIYLAKVTRVEPALQAAFVEYGGNRHGFLAFSEIHPDYYQIPQADRAALLAELEAAAEAEERGSGRDRDREQGGRDRDQGGRRRRGRGDRRGARPTEARAGEEPGGEELGGEEGGGVVEVIEDEEADDIVEAGAEAPADEGATAEFDDAGEEDDAGEDDDAGGEDDAGDQQDAGRRAAEDAEDVAWLRAVHQDSAAEAAAAEAAAEAAAGREAAEAAAAEEAAAPAGEGRGEGFAAFAAVVEAAAEDGGERPAHGKAPVPGARREVSRTGEATSGDIERETRGAVSGNAEPAALGRARRQVEETIEADIEAAVDNPIREVEVERGPAPDADSAGRTGADVRDPPVARDPSAAAPAQPAEAEPGDAAAKPRRTRKPAAAKPRKAAAKADEAAAPAADEPAPEEPAASAADATADDGGAAKKRRPARRTAKKSDTGLADPMVLDDDDADQPVEQVGGNDVADEVPERRRVTPKKQYKIQEVVKRRQILLVQVVKEERGNKGAALTTYLSLAGRYSVLMPNTDRGGGVSRKITDQADRRRLKELVEELEVPEGMGIILRTAGANRTKMEIRRDFEYLIRLWESVRDLTLKSIAPALVYEEGNLVKRAIRDQYTKEIDEILVAGEPAYSEARDFMKMLMPGHDSAVKPYRDPTPVFARFGVESQLDAMFSPQVTLPSKGYIVINPTEALVSIDVNSGRSTKEHSIEDTALKTNLEAADEVARQLRLRDLAGLIVIDFIDMDEKRHNRQVEARLKNALKLDRSRIQIGRISPFGLLEMSRQRMRQGMIETSMVPCATCGGTGHVRSTQSVALHCLRMLEAHLLKHAEHDVTLKTTSSVALYILNQKRAHLNQLEERFGLEIEVHADESLTGQHLEIVAGAPAARLVAAAAAQRVAPDAVAAEDLGEFEGEGESPAQPAAAAATEPQNGERGGRRRRRRRRRGGNGEARAEAGPPLSPEALEGEAADFAADMEGEDDDEGEPLQAFGDERDDESAAPEGLLGEDEDEAGGDEERGSRRRGRRGGRRHRRDDRPAAPEERGARAEAPDEAGLAWAEEAEAGETDVAWVEEAEAGFDRAEEDDAAPATGDAELAPTPAAPRAADLDAAAPATEAAEAAPAVAEAREPAPEQKSEPRPRRSGWWRPRIFP